MKNILGITTGCAVSCFASIAAAEIGSGRLTAEITIELQSDFTVDSSNPANEFNDTFLTIEGALSFAITDKTSLNATLLIEPVKDPLDDRFLEDHGFYAEELFFAHDFGAAEVVLGKFNPTFGVAWGESPGIYGVDFAEDYEIAEKLGAAVTIPFAGAGGEHAISLAAFTADRTFLSNSLGTERGEVSLSDGGVSNTNNLDSFAIAVAGNFGATNYNLGYQHQARGIGDVEDQSGVVLGVTHGFEGSFAFDLLGEVAYFSDFDGASDSATFYTIGAAAPVGPVTVSGVYSVRDIDGAPTDTLLTVSAEMELFNNLVGAVAYRYGEEGGDDNHTIGTLFVMEF